MESRDHDPTSGRTSGNNETTTGTSEDSAQSSGRKGTGRSVPPKRKGLARRQESSPALSDAQISPQTSWPVPYHGTSFTRRLSARSSPDLDHPRRVSCESADPLSRDRSARGQPHEATPGSRRRGRRVRGGGHRESPSSREKPTTSVPSQMEGIPRGRQLVGTSGANLRPRTNHEVPPQTPAGDR